MKFFPFTRVFFLSCLMAIFINFPAYAATQNVDLGSDAWQVFAPDGGNASIVSTSDGVAFKNSGYQQEIQAISKSRYDLRNATVYIKWKVHSSSGNYSDCGVGVGWLYVDELSELDVYSGAAAGASIPTHGPWFTTDYATAYSVAVSNDTWYFTRIKISLDKSVEVVTATNNFDDAGGTVFYSSDFTLSQEDWQNLSSAGITATLIDNSGEPDIFDDETSQDDNWPNFFFGSSPAPAGDNDSGPDTLLIIGAAAIDFRTDALLLSNNTEKTLVNLTWTDVPQIQNYVLYYALPDTFGEIDVQTIGSLDMGKETSFSIELPSGLMVYTAIVGYDAAGNATLSNIEKVFSFGGTVSFPESGTTLMEIDDPGGLGSVVFTGTPGENGPEFPVTSVTFDDGTSGPFSLFFDQTGEISRYVRGDVEIQFTPDNNGGFSYEIRENGNTIYQNSGISAPVTTLMELSSTPQAGSSSALPITVDCTDSKDEFLARIEQTDVIRKLKEDIFMAAAVSECFTRIKKAMIVELAVSIGRGDVSQQTWYLTQLDQVALMLRANKVLLSRSASMILNIRTRAAASYEANCNNDQSSSPDDTSQSGDNATTPDQPSSQDSNACGSCPIPQGAENYSEEYKEYYMLNGKMVGPYVAWFAGPDDTAVADCECRDENGLLHGTAHHWNEAGGEIERATYEHGRILSYVTWYPDQAVKKTVSYDYGSGRQVAEVKQYYDDPTPDGGLPPLACEWKEIEGILEGKMRCFYQNGNLNSETNYVNGQKEGYSIVYREDGTKDHVTEYSNGKIVERTWYEADGKTIMRTD